MKTKTEIRKRLITIYKSFADKRAEQIYDGAATQAYQSALMAEGFAKILDEFEEAIVREQS